MSKNRRDIEYVENSNTLIGTRTRKLIDAETGELLEVNQVSKMVYGSKNFWKCYLMDFLTVLGILDSKQVDVFIYIVENTSPSSNLFIGTYDEIAKAVGCCRQTIASIMKKLQANNFIKKKQQGVWIINPDILMKGNDNKRQILLEYYNTDESINTVNASRKSKKGKKKDDSQDEQEQTPEEQIKGQMEIVNTQCDMQEVGA